MEGSSISSGMSSSLKAIKQISQFKESSFQKLWTGKDVNGLDDGAAAYLASYTLDRDSEALDARLDGIQTGISLFGISQNSMKSIGNLLLHMRGAAELAAASYSEDEVDSYNYIYKEVRRQIVDVAKNAEFDGFNLLLGRDGMEVDDYLKSAADGGVPITTPDERTFQFGIQTDDRTHTIKSINIFESSEWVDTYADEWDVSIQDTEIKKNIVAVENFKVEMEQYSSDSYLDETILHQRDSFIRKHSEILKEGADSLTLADLNEVAAEIMAGDIAQRLSENTLKISNVARENFLKILGT